ncbi:N-sulphoglucosamine sulphohydrolase [Harmonia axyridis]|uniref:N-sulphoglucosamine sulphohydrolase n=1 Tax=Harmonia axyridis TaxID=115357 RepID=UPI001E277FF6|nr:N-sulphoglucosamine sulphohydrolase [Harmonia axyridis]
MAGTWLLLVFFLFEFEFSKGNPRQQNVLLIVADDAGFQLGTYREKICQTPNIDALAKRSLIFNKAYTSVSSCSPSRSALLTGLPSHKNGMYGLHQANNHFNSFDDIISLPNVLSDHNITTGIIGKKHLGPSSVYRFDYEQTEENNSILQVGRNITHIKLLVREFLSNVSQPFLLYVAFHDPHRCGHTNPEYGEFCEKFGNGEKGMGRIPDWEGIYYQPDEIILPYHVPDTLEAREDFAAQYTTMSRLDQGVGLVLKELKTAGYLDNTLIIFSSDNAIPFPNGRTNMYDSGVAVPLFISSPFNTKRWNQVTNSLTSLLDISPTIYDWFNIDENVYLKKEHKLTGKTLLPLLDKEPTDFTKEVIFGSHNLHEVTMYYPMRMIRTQRYKLIHNLNYNSAFPIDQDSYLSPTFQGLLNRSRAHKDLRWYKTLNEYYYRKEWELYDMKYDSEELINLAYNVTYKPLLKELKLKLFEWQNKTQDPWICAPHAVLEDKGAYKNDPQCMSLDN